MTPSDKDDRDQTDRSAGGTRRGGSRQSSRPRTDSAYLQDFAQAVGHTIKVFRTDLGMARRELADTVGISYSYLTEIENGNKPASANILGPIADALGLRLSQLTEAAERRQESWNDPDRSPTSAIRARAQAAPPSDSLASRTPPPDRAYAADPMVEYQQLAMQPSLRGQHRELRTAILELERLLARMAPDDIERLLDYARRLAR